MSARLNSPTSLDKAVSERIRMVRIQRGMTLKEVADQLGIEFQQLHKYESGLVRVSAGMLIWLADVLDCQIDDLVPPEFQGETKLGENARLDLLKQDIVKLVMNCKSERVLMAYKTLLSRPNNQQEDDTACEPEKSSSGH